MRSPVRVPAAVCAAVLVAVSGTRWAGAASTGPAVFDVVAEAAPVAVTASAPALLPLDVDTGVARSSVAINSQPNAISQAAVVYLPLAEAAPALFSLPSPPAQVLPYCYSYFPGDPREAACGGPAPSAGLFEVAAGSGRTTSDGEAADPTTLHSAASVAAARVSNSPALPVPVKISGVASAARAGADDTGRMAAGASAEVTDLDVAGVLRVGSLRTAVTAAVGGTPGSVSHEETMTISGVTVAGQPVEIGNDGVRVVGQDLLGGELTAAQKQVDQALAAVGIQVRTVPPTPAKVADDGTAAEVNSGGLMLSFANATGGVRVELRLGVSRVVLSAYRDVDVGAAVADAETDGAAPGREPAVSGEGPIEGTSSDVVLSPAPQPPPPPAAGADAGPPSATFFRREKRAVDLSSTWHVPYPPFAALVLAAPVLVQVRRLSFRRR